MHLEKDPAKLHTPVLLERTIELLAPAISRSEAVMVDGTLGMGGHSEALLERFTNLKIVGIDRDPEALQLAGGRLARFGERVVLRHAIYDQLGEVLDELEIPTVDGILLDLGVSSLQLDQASRGFAYAQDAPLDMRMNTSEGESAATLVNEWSKDQLAEIFYRYGEEPLAARYAEAIVRERKNEAITSSARLVDILQDATPYAKKNQRHPAKRVFQALRIAVNDELKTLESTLPQVLERLAPGGRAVVLSYHSLEDRIVKNVFQASTRSRTPKGVPMEIPELAAKFRPIVRGSEPASAEEQNLNPRSKPVRLRAIEKIGASA